MLIDTHCHLNHERLRADVEGCLERARAVGVEQVIVVGCDAESSREALSLAESYPTTVFASIGVHPHEAKSWDDATAQWMIEVATHPKVIAIGEIGLDFHYDFSPRSAQYTAFHAQMHLAKQVGLPIIIHCREAYPEVLEVLEQPEFSTITGVMHCWAGSVDEARRTVKRGYSLGIGGTLTFKNAENVRQSAQTVPLEKLLVETDAPYLAPVPHRGKQNEPAYTRIVAERLAELRGIPFSQLTEQTTQNAYHLFPKLKA